MGKRDEIKLAPHMREILALHTTLLGLGISADRLTTSAINAVTSDGDPRSMVGVTITTNGSQAMFAAATIYRITPEVLEREWEDALDAWTEASAEARDALWANSHTRQNFAALLANLCRRGIAVPAIDGIRTMAANQNERAN